MEMNKNIYIGIFLVGLVFSILSLSSYGMDSALTVLFFTITFILLIKLYLEYRYYRGYRAPLASGIFLLIPSAIALGASFISRAPELNGDPFLSNNLLSIDLRLLLLSPQPIYLFANLFAIIFALPFYIILLVLLNRYYTGIYPRLFLMRKKFYKQFAMYFDIILMGLLVFEWISLNSIEIFELAFVIISVIFIIRTYVFKVVLVPVRAVPSRNRRNAPRRSYTNTNANRTRNTASSSPSPRPNASTSTRTQQPRNPRLTPSPARPVSQPRTPTRSPSSGTVQVAEGIPVNQVAKAAKTNKINRNNVKDLIPNVVNLSEDDFRCIFCYELPTKPSDQVVICPNCKKPSHFPEYQKWIALSNICSYCNQDTGSRVPKRISGKTYKQIINASLRG